MKILVDEHIPLATVRTLRLLGHDVVDIRGTDLEGLDDDRLWELAQSQRRILITTDKGFARRRHLPHAGTLIVRLRQPNAHKLERRITSAISQFTEEEWQNTTLTVRDTARSVWRPKSP